MTTKKWKRIRRRFHVIFLRFRTWSLIEFEDKLHEARAFRNILEGKPIASRTVQMCDETLLDAYRCLWRLKKMASQQLEWRPIDSNWCLLKFEPYVTKYDDLTLLIGLWWSYINHSPGHRVGSFSSMWIRCQSALAIEVGVGLYPWPDMAPERVLKRTLFPNVVVIS
jgi:hypothetical protein